MRRKSVVDGAPSVRDHLTERPWPIVDPATAGFHESVVGDVVGHGDRVAKRALVDE